MRKASFCVKCRAVFFGACAICGAAEVYLAEKHERTPMVRYEMDHGQDPEGPVWPIQTRPLAEVRSASATMPFNNSTVFSNPPPIPRHPLLDATFPNVVLHHQNSGDAYLI